MRVAVIVRSLKIGGMERVAVNLSEAFADAGDESHLIYFKDKKRVFSPKKSVHFHHFNLDKALDLTVIGFVLKLFAKLLNAIFRGTYFIYSGLLASLVGTPTMTFFADSLFASSKRWRGVGMKNCKIILRFQIINKKEKNYLIR